VSVMLYLLLAGLAVIVVILVDRLASRADTRHDRDP